MKKITDIITFLPVHGSDIDDVEQGQIFQQFSAVYIKIKTSNYNAVDLRTGLAYPLSGRCRILGTIGVDV